MIEAILIVCLSSQLCTEPIVDYFEQLADNNPEYVEAEIGTALHCELVDKVAECHEHNPQPTRKRRAWSPSSGAEQWRSLVSAHFPESEVNRALCVLDGESIGGNPDATNPSSGAAGLFQHLPKYWSDRSAKAGWAGADVYDPEANVAVAAWLWRTGGWSHWTWWLRGNCR